MHKKIFTALITLVSALILSACSESNTPQLDKHFSKLPHDVTSYGLSPITEVFSLTCGHCLNMEEHLPEIEKLTNQTIGKVHVTFNQSAKVSAMFYYTAEMQFGKKPPSEFLQRLFKAMQQRDITDQDRQALLEGIYTDAGIISPYQLSKKQSASMLQLVTVAEEISSKADINSVPSFIIKGKYLLNTEEHKDIQQLADTINFILSDPNL